MILIPFTYTLIFRYQYRYSYLISTHNVSSWFVLLHLLDLLLALSPFPPLSLQFLSIVKMTTVYSLH